MTMTLQEQLELFQWKQLKHDELYHKEISLLNVQDRIKHMVLHLSKYGAKLVLYAYENQSQEYQNTLIDGLIISTSTLNTLNMNSASFLIGYEDSKLLTLQELAIQLFKIELSGTLDIEPFNRNYLISVGKMCKTTESMDHLEPIPFRESLIKETKFLFKQHLAILSQTADKPIIELVENRLMSVEQKNIFFNRLGNYAGDYDVLERR